MVWTCDEDWVKKFTFRVEGRRPVGRPRRTWLEGVGAAMAELAIGREDGHDIKKWRNDAMKIKFESLHSFHMSRKAYNNINSA